MKAMSKRAMLGSGAAALMLFSGAALAHPGHLGHELRAACSRRASGIR